MSQWGNDNLNCDFKAIHCKLEQFERDIQSVSQNAGYTDCDMSSDGMYVEQKRSMEDRIHLLQRELDALDEDGLGPNRGRNLYRTQSPGELSRVKGRTRSYQNVSRGTAKTSSRRTSSGSRGNGCNCKCNASFFDSQNRSDPERDSQLHELRNQLRDVNTSKRELQERIFSLEETQRQADNDTQMLQSQLESDRIKCRQLEEENDELMEEIRRLEVALNNLPVGDNGALQEAASQITGLLQALNDDMIKAPDLCNRLRMAAQQILEGEKRLSNEKSTRAMDQVEVEYLRNENQRLRELAFRANMSAFQASVQLPQNQFDGYNQALGPPFSPGGACYDPYMQGMQGGVPPGAPPRRKSVLQRMFSKKDNVGMQQQGMPQQGSMQMSPSQMMMNQAAMNNPRASVGTAESPEDAEKRLQMANQQEKEKTGCFS